MALPPEVGALCVHRAVTGSRGEQYPAGTVLRRDHGIHPGFFEFLATLGPPWVEVLGYDEKSLTPEPPKRRGRPRKATAK
jgi:hypothetical protein